MKVINDNLLGDKEVYVLWLILQTLRSFFSAILFLVLAVMVTGIWCCSDWYKDSPCFCACEDVGTECKKNCIPHYAIPHDEIVKTVCDTYCKFDSLNCMRNCVAKNWENK